MADYKDLTIDKFFSKEVTQEIKIDQRTGQAMQANKNVYIPLADISEMLDDDTLNKIGMQVVQDYNYDKETMNDWLSDVEKAIELMKQAKGPRQGVYNNMTNYKSSLLTQVCLGFSDRAASELLRDVDLVHVGVVGDDDVNDQTAPGMRKKDIARRVEMFLNWQVNTQMKEWREEQEKVIYDLPYVGCCFKKIYFDPSEQRITSRLITYPNFVVNNKCHSQARLERFSEPFEITENEFVSLKRQGIYRDVELYEDESEKDYQEIDSSSTAYTFIEQDTYYDLDGDGYKEPYTCIVHKDTSTVVRVFPRFRLEDVEVATKDNPTGVSIADLDGQVTVEVTDYGMEEVKAGYDLKESITKIPCADSLIKYDLLKDMQGGFLGVGFSHLLTALIEGINATTNMLVDAGKIANMPAAFLSKEHRAQKGVVDIQPGEFKQTQVAANLLQASIARIDFKEPSAVLYQLNENMKMEVDRLAASVDMTGVLGPNTPATTALAYVEEQQRAHSAIILRMYRAMTKEFNLIYKLNSIYLDQIEYMKVIDSKDAMFNVDFATENFDITPSANPEVSSKVQRLMKANALVMQAPLMAQSGVNVIPIYREYLQTLDMDDDVINEVAPNEQPLQQVQRLAQQFPDVAEFISSQQAATEATMQEQMNQMKLDQQRKDMELAAKLDKMEDERRKMNSEILLNLEKAESEEVKNGISIYTAGQQKSNI